MIPTPYVWVVWASAFLVPWALLYWRFPMHRRVMRWSSVFTAPFGLTEPLFVPRYWDPPSLFDLAQRTGFDIESLIFCFGIGGVAAVLVNVLTGRVAVPLTTEARQHRRHRLHRWVLLFPFVSFVALLPLDWNPIYPGILAMLAGAAASVWCRPDLLRSTAIGSVVFTLYYTVFLAGLEWSAPPGYINTVWNLEALSEVLLGFVPLEELLFAAGFGAYWVGVYEHFTWHHSQSVVREDRAHALAS
ncbi:MAG: lycopene cyclase domain-containing protein [Gemmatimonadaceae bacterium]